MESLQLLWHRALNIHHLLFEPVSDVTTAERAALRLHVCATPYDFSERSAVRPITLGYLYDEWRNVPHDWTNIRSRTVYLSLAANNPATGAPAVAGTPRPGRALTANAGTMRDADGLPAGSFPAGYGFQWVRVDGDVETDIPGATSRTFTPQPGDVGKSFKVKVSFRDRLHVEGDDLETLISEASGAVMGGSTVLVSNLGETAGSTGLLTPSNAYEIFQAFTTGGAATLTGIDVRMSYTGGGGTGRNMPTMTLHSSRNTAALATLSAATTTVPGNWTILTYNAPAGGIDLTANTTYHVKLDGGDPVLVETTDQNGETSRESGWSIADEYHINVTGAPINVPADHALYMRLTGSLTLANTPAAGVPTISGYTEVGLRLTAHTSGITDGDGLTGVRFAYQWQRVDDDGMSNPTDIGANSDTYTPVAADIGSKIRVRVGFTDDAGYVESLLSEPTAAVTANTCTAPDLGDRRHFWTGRVTILNGEPGQSNGYGQNRGILDERSFSIGASSYLISSLSVDSATGALEVAFRRTTLTAGHRAALRLHNCSETLDFSSADQGAGNAVNAFSWPGSRDWSAASPRTLYLSLPPDNPATGAPAISGPALVDQTLAADAGGIEDADGLTGADFAWQWLRVDEDGSSNPVEIPGAITATYTLTAADTGKKIKVRASFRDDLHVASYTAGGVATAEAPPETRTSEAWPSSGTVGAMEAGNNAPEVAHAIPDQTATEGLPFRYQVAANAFSDADGDTLSYSAVRATAGALPAWLRFDPATRTFSGTPLPGDAETVTVKLTASDGRGGAVGDEFAIVVSATLDAPFLVSNIGRSRDDELSLASNNVLASFTTGNRNVRISSVLLDLRNGLRRPATTVPVAGIYTGTSDGKAQLSLESKVLSLAGPASIPAGSSNVTYTAASDVELVASTTYHIVLEWGAGELYWSTTSSSALDAGGEARWAIPHGAGQRDGIEGALGHYLHGSGNGAPRFRLRGTLTDTNTPATGAPEITGVAQVGQTLTADADSIYDANGLTGAAYTWQWQRVDTDGSNPATSARIPIPTPW